MTEYQYEHGEPLEHRFVYAYSPVLGPSYVGAFAAARSRARSDLETQAAQQVSQARSKPAVNLDKILQRFEVTGKVYTAYERSGRAAADAAWDELERYVEFAEWLDEAYARSGTLVYLNALLKALDVVCAERQTVTDLGLAHRIIELIDAEGRHIADLDRRSS